MSTRKDKDDHDSQLATVESQECSSGVVGHATELARNFGLISLTGLGLVVGNVWPASGGTVLVAIFNGGPPGVLYEFIVVSVCYWTVAASIAELASAIPSSAGVYHFASVTPGKRWGRVTGFFTGWWNYLAWVMGSASMASIWSNGIVQIYAFKHVGFEPQAWHVFIVYIISTWISCLVVCFFNRAMPHLNNVGMFFILGGFLITIIILAAMPGHGGRPPHATSTFVWKTWSNDLGYPSSFVFLLGMLNGAYSVGAVDVVTHLAEEIPNPRRNVPIAMGFQMVLGFITGFSYLVALMYSINDYDALFDSPFPIIEIYRQATGSVNGAIGLLCLILLCIGMNMFGLYVTAGRTLWTLARDGATPFSNKVSHINPSLGMPLHATISTAVLVTVLGCIYVGSTTAFNAFVGAYVLMSSSSYISTILPHILTGRKNIQYGPFKLGRFWGFLINGIGVTYMMVWFVIYCFPFSLPVNAQNMNYACLIWGGLTILIGVWWFIDAAKGYRGPLGTAVLAD